MYGTTSFSSAHFYTRFLRFIITAVENEKQKAKQKPKQKQNQKLLEKSN